MSKSRMRALPVFASLAVMAIVTANVAHATIPDADGTVHACVTAKGKVRFIDHDNPDHKPCKAPPKEEHIHLTSTAGGWLLGGNAGTTPGADFIGTTDNQGLQFKVNGDRALRLEPNATSPNVIGGFAGNGVSPESVHGAFIGGGGDSSVSNVVTDDFGTVAGGKGNRAGDGNDNATGSTFSSVGGGSSNIAGGGSSTVGGGSSNSAGGVWATIGGGANNQAFVSGTTIAGGHNNFVGGQDGTVGGGDNNSVNGNEATIAGGFGNLTGGSAPWATIGGGTNNRVLASYGTVGGGLSNEAAAWYATIAGGGRTDPADANTRNRVTDDYGTISGGGGNIAGDGDSTTTNNTYATVGGGRANVASADEATVGGGAQNIATALRSTVGGGFGNDATFSYATVGGGLNNVASGDGATVPGGASNTASAFGAFAAGQRAVADDQGAFVWGDTTSADFNSSATNEFSARASGGFRFRTQSDLATGCNLPASSGTFACTSSKAAKTNFDAIDAKDVLATLDSLPIEKWAYKGRTGITHIGPYAEDFYEAFGVGEGSKTISTVDADGVALAAIKGLHQVVKEQKSQIEKLEGSLAAQHVPAEPARQIPWITAVLALISILSIAIAGLAAGYVRRLAAGAARKDSRR